MVISLSVLSRNMHSRIFLIVSLILMLVTGIAGCTTPSSPIAQQSSPAYIPTSVPPADPGSTFGIQVDSLIPESQLPVVNTCTGESKSPAVSWDLIPPGTKSMVLILDDPDAPSGVFTHWIVYNIPPVAGGFSEGQPDQKVLDNGAQVGENSAGSRGYYPPCPPVGTTHRYIFRLYAVDMDITQPAANRDSLDHALLGHTIAKTEFATIFRR